MIDGYTFNKSSILLEYAINQMEISAQNVLEQCAFIYGKNCKPQIKSRQTILNNINLLIFMGEQ